MIDESCANIFYPRERCCLYGEAGDAEPSSNAMESRRQATGSTGPENPRAIFDAASGITISVKAQLRRVCAIDTYYET